MPIFTDFAELARKPVPLSCSMQYPTDNGNPIYERSLVLLISRRFTIQQLLSHRVIAIAGVVLALAAWSLKVGEASAEAPIRLCVPEAAGKAVTSAGAKGTCAAEEKTVELPGTAELALLRNMLAHMAYVAAGVAGKPTIQFKAVNVQIISGSGSTAGTVNGEGNLVIGYNEGKRSQTGSHNLVLGTSQSFTSYGGFLAGSGNTVTGPYASVSGGRENTVSREVDSISGGILNSTTATGASVSGGSENIAEGNNTSISGGSDNRAEATGSSINGGFGNITKQPGNWASILGGHEQSVNIEFAHFP